MRHFFVFVILLYGSYHDIKTMEVPDACFLLIMCCAPKLSLGNALEFLGVFVFYFVLIMVCGILNLGVPFGMADAKIFAALSFSFGLTRSLWTFCTSSIISGIYAVFLLLFKKISKKDCFPYVPFITAAWSAYLLQLLLQGR